MKIICMLSYNNVKTSVDNIVGLFWLKQNLFDVGGALLIDIGLGFEYLLEIIICSLKMAKLKKLL